MSTVKPNSRRRKGAQPGNQNARKHGFYSSSFTPQELAGLESEVKGEFLDEIELARVNARRLGQILNDYREMSFQDVLSASRALTNYLARIESLHRSQRFLYSNQTTIEQALEQLDYIPPEED